MLRVLVALVLLSLVFCLSSAAQPTGTIAGTVTDESGAVVPNGKISITNKATGVARTVTTNQEGYFSATALSAGEYEVKAEVAGFRTVIRPATVQVGETTQVNMPMTLGQTQEVVTVEAAASQINYENNQVSGVITHAEIQDLPLNGRSYMQLAGLEPGVTVTADSTSQANALFNVNVIGAGNRTIFSIDGGSVFDNIDAGNAASAMNFSQELIQEFQLSALNADISTNITAGGSINVVTRSGTNDFHGSAYFYYRDHNMAAFPNLQHFPGEPLNPFFDRKQPGATIGGPIKKDQTFFFFSYEHTQQVQAIATAATDPGLAPLGTAYASPYLANLYSIRFDHRIGTKNQLFLRYSHDGNTGFGPALVTGDPSDWTQNINWADQSIIGLTTTFSPTIVNDARFQYNYWANHNLPTQSCSLPCVPGVPTTFTTGGFDLGNNLNSPQARNTRRYEGMDNLSWQKGSHRIKFGGDFNRAFSAGLWGFCTPFCEGALTPANVGAIEAAFGPIYAPILGPSFVPSLFANVPTVLTNDAQALNLPLSSLNNAIFEGVGVGATALPSNYNRAENAPESQYRLYVQDTWKIRPNLTVNYGLAWNAQTGYFSEGFTYPQYLAPIFGSNMPDTANNLHEFQPSFGFSWSPFKNNKTVIRGGGGIYWDSTPGYYKNRSPASIGPPGASRATLASSAFTNIFPGIFDLSAGKPLAIGAPIPVGDYTNLTVGQFETIVAQQIGRVQSLIAPGPLQTSGPYSISGIDYTKTGVEIFPPGSFAQPRSYQTSLGVQRDMGYGVVVTADWARRQGENVSLGEVDLNDYNYFVNGVRSPVIPQCTQAQLYVPGQECSNGAITVWTDQGRSVYEGLLVKATKRLSNHFQALVSYAYQQERADTGYYNVLNYESGYQQILPHQNLNISGIVTLPWRFQLSVNSSMISRTPATATIGADPLPGVDLNGGQPLPGLPLGCLNNGCGKAQIAAAVAAYNSTYAGTKAQNGNVFPKLVLPPNYGTGSALISQDFRLQKTFAYKERYMLNLFGELFNAFNVANYSGISETIDSVNATATKAQTYAFGQPTQRIAQTFGQGGPRALQVGARITF